MWSLRMIFRTINQRGSYRNLLHANITTMSRIKNSRNVLYFINPQVCSFSSNRLLSASFIVSKPKLTIVLMNRNGCLPSFSVKLLCSLPAQDLNETNTSIADKPSVEPVKFLRKEREVSSEEEVKRDMVNNLGETLQCLERLRLSFRSYQTYSPVHAEECLNSSRDDAIMYSELKSLIEGSSPGCKKLRLKADQFSKIKGLLGTYRPSKVSKEIADDVKNELLNAYDDTVCCKILVAYYSMDPWLYRLYPQIDTRILTVVYQGNADEVLLPFVDSSDCLPYVAKDWCLSYEARDMKRNFILNHWKSFNILVHREKLILISSPEWNTFESGLLNSVINSRKIVDDCRLRLVRCITLRYDPDPAGLAAIFSECLRSLDYLKNLLLKQLDCSNEIIAEIDELMHGIMNHNLVDPLLESWKTKMHKFAVKISQVLSDYQGADISSLENDLIDWAPPKFSLQSATPNNDVLTEEDITRVKNYQTFMRGPLLQMNPNDILMIAKGGSHLYNLATKFSDIDYYIIFRRIPKNQDTTLRDRAGVHYYKSEESGCEYKGFEARTFCKIIYKGAVVPNELVLANRADFVHPEMKPLLDSPGKLLSERLIIQYLGMIRAILMDVSAGTRPGVEYKDLYQAFHKIMCLEDIVAGKNPRIYFEEGPDRDYIMAIRENKTDAQETFHEAWSRYRSIRHALSQRRHRLNECADYQFLASWVRDVRGYANTP